MPVTPDHSRAFLAALSDFWALYFKDRDVLRAYAEGLELNAAQVYQRLLESALGGSLDEVPLFSRDFFRPYILRESDVRFREGASPDDDAYVVDLYDRLVDAPFLANRPVMPTAVLVAPREYRVEPGRLVFRRDPFGGALARFPERTATVVAPATWTDPARRPWDGATPGDALRVAVGGVTSEATITGVQGERLYLDGAPDALRTEVARRGARAWVLRTPYDDTVTGALLPDHPTRCDRLTPDATDGALAPGAGTEVDVTAASTYRGAWGPAAYAAGDLVTHDGRVWRAEAPSAPGDGFVPERWDDLATGFFYLAVPDDPRHDGLYAANTPSAPGRVNVFGLPPDASLAATLHRVRYAGAVGERRAVLRVDHTHLAEGSVVVEARRATRRVVLDDAGNPVVYDAYGAVREGVDYRVDAETGAVIVASAWDPTRPARVSYRWRLEVASAHLRWTGPYGAGNSYVPGDLLTHDGSTLVVVEPHTSGVAFDPSYYRALDEPAAFDVDRVVREVGVWATDALLDEDRLYRNFGHLLGRRRPSSEAQREFLRAVSRLFLQGPSFPLIESALNAVAGLPLVREAGERLVAYADGVAARAETGRLLDTMQGTDGALDPAASQFAAPSAAFDPTDVGATLRVVAGERVEVYAVAAYVSPTVVAVSPRPARAAAGLAWEARHAALTNRLRVDPAGGHRFRAEDVGTWVRLRGRQPRNQGVFRVVTVDDAFTVELDTPYGFVDAADVPWEHSVEGAQVVRTDAREYRVPLGVPVRAPLRDPANAGRLELAAFDPVSDAFAVVDYLTDPAWWHHVQIPRELFDADDATRTVTPALVEHVYGALDAPRYGDAGLQYGADDEGAVPEARPFVATWYGGDTLALAFSAGVTGLQSTDLGSYLVVATPGFAGQYRVTRVDPTAGVVRLHAFPPPEARGVVPPVVLDGELPPILLRHAVAYVLMDKLLKFHCMQVRVHPSVQLPRDVVGDLVGIVGAARPSHVYVFVEAGTRFEEVVDLDEAFSMDVNRRFHDPLDAVDSAARYVEAQLLRYGDAYRFVDRSATFAMSPGGSADLPTVLPAYPTAARSLVRVGFDPAARVGSRMPCEGVDYDVDYVACKVSLRAGVVVVPSTVTIHYVDCIRRTVGPGGALDAGEVPVVYGGADPTVVRERGGSPLDAGFLDRAIEITFGV